MFTFNHPGSSGSSSYQCGLVGVEYLTHQGELKSFMSLVSGWKVDLPTGEMKNRGRLFVESMSHGCSC